MGVATGVGMLSSTALTLLVVPVFYLALEDFVAWFRVAPRRLRRALRRGVGRARHGRGLAGGDSPVASPRVDR
jgi:hypothetical protein